MSACCGAGMFLKGGILEIRPHEMNCPVLRQIAERSQTHCTTCDSPLTFEQNGDVWYCPNGHTSGMKNGAVLDFLEATGAGWIGEV
jgi:uncharacterized Zn finger protein (UPF0148 family)